MSSDRVLTDAAMRKWFDDYSVMAGSANDLVDIQDLSGTSLKRVSVKAKTLAEIDDLTFFSLGPVYVLGRVGYDMLAEFKTYTGTTAPMAIFAFSKPIFKGLAVTNEYGTIVSSWDSLLAAVPNEVFATLQEFVLTQSLYRTDPRYEYWEIFAKQVVIPDPLAIENKVAVGKVCVNLFLPTGNAGKADADFGTLLSDGTVRIGLGVPELGMTRRAGLVKDLVKKWDVPQK